MRGCWRRWDGLRGSRFVPEEAALRGVREPSFVHRVRADDIAAFDDRGDDRGFAPERPRAGAGDRHGVWISDGVAFVAGGLRGQRGEGSGAGRAGGEDAGGARLQATSRCMRWTRGWAGRRVGLMTRSSSRRRRRKCRWRCWSSSPRAGRLVIPVGGRDLQELVRIIKTPEGALRHNLGPCRFVPLVGRLAWPQGRNR